jgi:hypothetical protein
MPANRKSAGDLPAICGIGSGQAEGRCLAARLAQRMVDRAGARSADLLGVDPTFDTVVVGSAG